MSRTRRCRARHVAADRRRAGALDRGAAGALVARVIDVKPRTASSEFIIIDAGMTELMRPALYGAFHRIEPVSGPESGDHHYEIVGPVCESSDVVGRDRMLPLLKEHDVADSRRRAYGAAMASNYNRRPRRCWWTPILAIRRGVDSWPVDVRRSWSMRVPVRRSIRVRRSRH
jgi:hypothetical protein